MMKKRDRGFTLLEVLLVAALGPVIIGMLIFMFQAALGTWSVQGARISLTVGANRAIRDVARDLRNASAIGSQNSGEIRYTADNATYFIYYLYNLSDPYPPHFNSTSYQLKKAALTGGMAGTFAYGGGDLIARDIVPPPVTNLSFSSPIVTIDLTVRQGDSVTRSSGMVKPRNL